MTLRDEIAHYAKCGMSIRATAEEMDIPYEKFKGIVRNEGLRGLFNSANYSRDCKGGGIGWPKGKRRPYLPRVSASSILEELRRYPCTTTFRSLADVDASTVIRRFGSLSAAHKFARTYSPSEPAWRYVSELADGKRCLT